MIRTTDRALRLADLDAVVGGGQTAAVTPHVQVGKAGTQPSLLVVIAIIAILIG